MRIYISICKCIYIHIYVHICIYLIRNRQTGQYIGHTNRQHIHHMLFKIIFDLILIDNNQ